MASFDTPFSSRSRFLRDFTNEEDALEVVRRQPMPREMKTSSIISSNNGLEARPEDDRNKSMRTMNAGLVNQPRSRMMDQRYHIPDSQHKPLNDYPQDLEELDFGLDDNDEQNLYVASEESTSRFSQKTSNTSSISGKMPNFFGPEVFQTVLHNPTTAHQLLLFSRSRLSGENMEFLEKINKYHALLNDVAKTIYDIHHDFVSVDAINQINIEQSVLIKTNKELKQCLAQPLPKLESVFADAQRDVERLIYFDVYPRFVRHQMTMSASKALAGNKMKYAGLGDCFVLTDPAKADNPIVYASDGFVGVTGYHRNEIIPRNCRFLQCSQTDRAAVKRLRQAIDRREDSVELLLNQKKDGEPFWNLLYTAPLIDDRGNTIFFLGGQIDCSTTIHSASDVLRILAQSSDVEDEKDQHRPMGSETVVDQPQPSRTHRIFSAFRSQSTTKAAQLIPTYAPGMENKLLDKIERLNLQKQMDTFHTAYSKFLVVNASTFIVGFHSAGILDLLFPALLASPPSRPATFDESIPDSTSPNLPRARAPSPRGSDVFKLLASYSFEVRLPKGFKEKVKTAVKAGQSISLALRLCTRRRMGYESFVIHWTTLKDERGDAQWLVVTMGGDTD